MPHSAVWAVRDACGLCLSGLTVIDTALYSIIKHTNVKQLCILFSAEEIFKDSSAIFYIWVSIERVDSF